MRNKKVFGLGFGNGWLFLCRKKDDAYFLLLFFFAWPGVLFSVWVLRAASYRLIDGNLDIALMVNYDKLTCYYLTYFVIL